MLILIAESKTMTRCEGAVTADLSVPAFGTEADEIMAKIDGMPVGELADRVKLSDSLMKKLRLMAREFPYKATGQAAIEAYTGVVFKALSYSILSPDRQAVARRDVRIISSVYGLLRPGDTIKPYRLDFTASASPDGGPLYSYWKPKVTALLLDALRQGDYKEILNLLPGDAAKCVDWTQIEPHAKVMKADFRAVTAGGAIKTPTSNRLKTLRGELARQIITDGIENFEQLAHTSSHDYFAEEVSGGSIVFTTV